MTTFSVDETRRSTAQEAVAPIVGSSALGRYHPGLDGLRGVAMVVMLAYHSELPFTDGAFLGLSQFFTLSGFLITSVLLRAHDRGGIDLKQFWVRRIRRLMPAALLCLAGVVLFGATVANREQAQELPGHVFASASYWANWFFIATDKSYVDLFAAPSPVQHFWSLAVEEQFYFVMPIGMVFLLARTRSPRVLGTVFAVGAVISTAWMTVLYRSGAGLDRIYYGTDTRMAEMLAGALLAVVVNEVGGRFTPKVRRILGVTGLLAYLVSLWGVITVPLADGPIWSGGLLAYSFLSCAVILGILSGSGPLGAVLSWGPLPSLGRITYGLYLYHWPIFLWLTPERTGLTQWPLFGLRLMLTFAAAVLSYHLVEKPVRDGAFGNRRLVTRALIAPVAVIAVVAGTVVATNRTIPDLLATIRSDDSSLTAPIEPGDGVLDLLVIADEADPAVVSRLEDLGGQDETLQVIVAEPFSCTRLVRTDAGRTCSDWLDGWPSLIEEHDPDLVLLYVEDWPTADIARVGGDGADPIAVAKEALGRGFDLLTTRGAPVLWAAPGSDFGVALARSAQPFAHAMVELEQDRTDLHHVLGDRLPSPESMDHDEYVKVSAAALIADASLYQRVDRGDLLRVMVLGDSQARSLGYGLERWGASSDRALVWNAATEGCGLADEGVEGSGQPTERCLNAVRSWARQVGEFRPDVVIALTSAWDLLDRRLPGWERPLSPGDPEFDAYLLAEFDQAVDTWTAYGAQVIWMTAPCNRFTPVPGQAAVMSGGFDDKRATHMNEAILSTLARERPDEVRLFDLDEVLCPGGQYTNEADGVEPIRSDGIHFSVVGSIWFAGKYGDELLYEGK